MSLLTIILIVLGVLVVVFAICGYAVVSRRRARDQAGLLERASLADQHLAAAHAEDKGWERGGLEVAARTVYAQRHGAEPQTLTLVQVVDRPGTDEDEAVFHADGEELRLGRRDGQWVGV